MFDFNKKFASTKAFFSSRFVKNGIPFIVFMLIAPFGLQKFTSLRYEYSTKSSFSYTEAEEQGIVIKKQGEVTLESEYEKIKNEDIDNWEPIRIPRPWDETIQ